jgi:hypothetical protein
VVESATKEVIIMRFILIFIFTNVIEFSLLLS